MDEAGSSLCLVMYFVVNDGVPSGSATTELVCVCDDASYLSQQATGSTTCV